MPLLSLSFSGIIFCRGGFVVALASPTSSVLLRQSGTRCSLLVLLCLNWMWHWNPGDNEERGDLAVGCQQTQKLTYNVDSIIVTPFLFDVLSIFRSLSLSLSVWSLSKVLSGSVGSSSIHLFLQIQSFLCRLVFTVHQWQSEATSIMSGHLDSNNVITLTLSLIDYYY